MRRQGFQVSPRFVVPRLYSPDGVRTRVGRPETVRGSEPGLRRISTLDHGHHPSAVRRPRPWTHGRSHVPKDPKVGAKPVDVDTFTPTPLPPVRGRTRHLTLRS